MKKVRFKRRFLLKRPLSLMLALCMVLALLPALSLPAYAADPVTLINVDNGKVLTAASPYFVNGQSEPTGRLGYDGCTAELRGGVLMLCGYSGGTIALSYGEPRDLKILLIGSNYITRKNDGAAYGIENNTDGDILIYTESALGSGSLDIVVESETNIANAITTSERGFILSDAVLRIEGDAQVSVLADSKSSNSAGVFFPKVEITGNASFTAACYSDRSSSSGLYAATGIAASQSITVNTTGNVHIDCSDIRNVNGGMPLYTDLLSDSIILERVGKMTLKWAESNLQGYFGSINYGTGGADAFEVLEDSNARTATYRYRDGSFEVTGISLSPTNPTVNKGRSLMFGAEVSGTGSYNDTVEWKVEGAASGGTNISDSGLLKVWRWETASSLTVTATARGDRSKTASTMVTVTDPPHH